MERAAAIGSASDAATRTRSFRCEGAGAQCQHLARFDNVIMPIHFRHVGAIAAYNIAFLLSFALLASDRSPIASLQRVATAWQFDVTEIRNLETGDW